MSDTNIDTIFEDARALATQFAAADQLDAKALDYLRELREAVELLGWEHAHDARRYAWEHDDRLTDAFDVAMEEARMRHGYDIDAATEEAWLAGMIVGMAEHADGSR